MCVLCEEEEAARISKEELMKIAEKLLKDKKENGYSGMFSSMVHKTDKKEVEQVKQLELIVEAVDQIGDRYCGGEDQIFSPGQLRTLKRAQDTALLYLSVI